MRGDGTDLVHISSPDEASFTPQTAETLAFMADDLAAKKGTMKHGEFEQLQRCYGLAYEPAAIIYNPYLRAISNFPGGLYWDWMHCLVASGGVAQYQCNQLLSALQRSGVSLDDLDNFNVQVTVPLTWQKLPKTFFKDRFVNGDDSHMKAFASEMITVIAVLGLFADAVLRPIGKLMDHISCLDDLRSIVSVLRCADDAVPLIPELRGRLRQHHVAFMKLYPGCAKPKIHYLKHCLDCIQKHRCNLSCFAPERKHKEAKHTANFSYKSLEKAMLSRMLYELVRCWGDYTIFTMCSLGPELKFHDAFATMLCPGLQHKVEFAADVATAKGKLHAGDVVWHGTQLCRFQACAKVSSHSEASFRALVVPFERVPGEGWSTREGSQFVVDVNSLSGTFLYFDLGTEVFV